MSNKHKYTGCETDGDLVRVGETAGLHIREGSFCFYDELRGLSVQVPLEAVVQVLALRYGQGKVDGWRGLTDDLAEVHVRMGVGSAEDLPFAAEVVVVPLKS